MSTRGRAQRRGNWWDQTGTTTLEYALLLALVTVTSLASYQALGRSTTQSAGGSNQEITAATEAGSSYNDAEGGATAPPSGG